MKITIIGAGAMGCLIGGLVQRGGHKVSYVGRGAQLEALQRDGLTLESSAGERWHTKVNATADTKGLDAQDAVLICTKAYQIEDVAPMVSLLLGPETVIVPIINGLPWWYFFKDGGEFDGRQLTSLDPHGMLAKHLPVDRIIGCVNYLAGHVERPGHIHYVPELQRRLVVGELDGSLTPRLEALAKALDDGGFAARRSEQIRQPIWHKLWGNIAFNPISALTHGTIDQIAESYRDIDLVSAVMNEARFVADKLGVELGQTTKSRVEAAAKMRGHKTSMLQDIEQGKQTEIEAIVGVVREIGKWLEVDTPHLNTLYSLVKLKENFYRADGSGQA